MTTTSVDHPTRRPRPITPTGIAGALVSRARRRLAGGVVGGDSSERPEAELAAAESLLTGLDDYCSAMTTAPSAALTALARRTAAEPWDRHAGPVPLEREMLSGHVEGALLSLLVRATGATRVLEIGMFTGYASLAMAEALPADGQVVACEIDPGVAALARDCFASSAAGGRVRVEVGPAAATLARLAEAGEEFDLVFLDADKAGYADYVRALLDRRLLRVGGLLVVDNTLHQGEPWATVPASANGRAVAAFNRALRDEPRLTQVVLPVRDGVTLALREPDPRPDPGPDAA